MPNYSAEPTPTLDPTFAALADATRRAVVERLSHGPASVKTLAQPFAMALPSFVQHLKVLEDCGLIGSEKVGRTRTCFLKKERFADLETWVAGMQQYWENRVDALSEYAEALHKENKGKTGDRDE